MRISVPGVVNDVIGHVTFSRLPKNRLKKLTAVKFIITNRHMVSYSILAMLFVFLFRAGLKCGRCSPFLDPGCDSRAREMGCVLSS